MNKIKLVSVSIFLLLFIISERFHYFEKKEKEIFHKSAELISHELEYYHRLQTLLSKEYALTPKAKSLHFYKKHCKSIEFYSASDIGDLLGWSELYLNSIDQQIYGKCITPVYDTKKWKVIGFLVGEYRLSSMNQLKKNSVVDKENRALIHSVNKRKYIEYFKYTNGWKLVG